MTPHSRGSLSSRPAPLTDVFIDIFCDKPCYFPGDTVNAHVTMKSKQPIRGDFIQVEIIGKEKAIYSSFVDPESSKDYRHTFISHKLRITTIQGGSLQPGEYEFKVKITLPEAELPQSLAHKNRVEEYSVDLAVKYNIRIDIMSEANNYVLKRKKHCFIVLEKIDAEYSFFQSQRGGDMLSTRPVKLCCMDQGIVKFAIALDRNVLYARETALGFLTVDNSNCKANISQIVYSVLQKLTIKNGSTSSGEIKVKRYVHKSTDHFGIESLYPQHVYRKVGLELNDVKYPVKQIKQMTVNKGKKKVTINQEMDPQKECLLSSMAPTCHGKHVTNEYFLTCILKYDGIINGEYPKMTIPLTVLPLPYQSGMSKSKSEAVNLGEVKVKVSYNGI